jgi:hypothetical protein
VGRVCGVAPKLRRCRATTTLLNNLSPSSTRRPAGSEVRILRTILSHDTITTHQTGGDPTHWGVAAHLAMFGIFGRSVGTSPSARERPRERSLAARDPTITDLVHGDTITEPRLNWYQYFSVCVTICVWEKKTQQCAVARRCVWGGARRERRQHRQALVQPR